MNMSDEQHTNSVRRHTPHGDARYPVDGPKFKIGEKVLCYTNDSPFAWHINMWQSPNDVFLARIINYNITKDTYIVRVTDFTRGHNGTKQEIKENQMVSWHKHIVVPQRTEMSI